MADDDWPTCKGTGKVQEFGAPAAPSAKLTDAAWVKCRDCGGTGKRAKR